MSESRIIRVHDFHKLAEQARREQRLIMLLVSQADCPYCHLVKEEVIHPMILGGDFKDEILIREIFIDAGEKLIDFQGRDVEAADFAHGYGVYVTPTLLFLGPDGRELAKQMVGVNTIEMYYYYVAQSVRAALQKLPGRHS
ncbi:thioredoxin family protein [Thiolapillus sp.]